VKQYLSFINRTLLGSGELMWSSILQAPRISRGSQSSDSSLGSSFGCSVGSSTASDTGNEGKLPM
jgi:hypothetical protein